MLSAFEDAVEVQLKGFIERLQKISVKESRLAQSLEKVVQNVMVEVPFDVLSMLGLNSFPSLLYRLYFTEYLFS